MLDVFTQSTALILDISVPTELSNPIHQWDTAATTTTYVLLALFFFFLNLCMCQCICVFECLASLYVTN